jgi:hypothetical protein
MVDTKANGLGVYLESLMSTSLKFNGAFSFNAKECFSIPLANPALMK